MEIYRRLSSYFFFLFPKDIQINVSYIFIEATASRIRNEDTEKDRKVL